MWLASKNRPLTAQTSIGEDIARMTNGMMSISVEVRILSASCFSRFFKELFKPTQYLVIVIADYPETPKDIDEAGELMPHEMFMQLEFISGSQSTRDNE